MQKREKRKTHNLVNDSRSTDWGAVFRQEKHEETSRKSFSYFNAKKKKNTYTVTSLFYLTFPTADGWNDDDDILGPFFFIVIIIYIYVVFFLPDGLKNEGLYDERGMTSS